MRRVIKDYLPWLVSDCCSLVQAGHCSCCQHICFSTFLLPASPHTHCLHLRRRRSWSAVLHDTRTLDGHTYDHA